MAPLPLFYRNVTVIDRAAHRSKRLRPVEAPFKFAASAHFIPAVMPEFPVSCRELPILFLSTPDGLSPVFITGTGTESNAYIRPDGSWAASYVPAYLRRYPFIAGDSQEGLQLVCIDATWPGFQDETGDVLFTETGEPTEMLTGIMRLVTEYSQAAKATQAFVNELQTLRLLRSVTVNFRTGEGGNATFHGFATIDEARLNELSNTDFTTLRTSGFLPGIYAQLISLANLQRLATLQPA